MMEMLVLMVLAVAAGGAGASSIFDGMVSSAPTGIRGADKCPCAESIDMTPEEKNIIFGAIGVENVSTFGLGCRQHDLSTSSCVNNNANYCDLNWCYVDRSSCDEIARTMSPSVPKLWYSYATCGEMDLYTKDALIEGLRGKTLNVAFNRNSGGWVGSYSTKNIHFEGPMSVWSGPVVDFVQESASYAGFNISLTPPLAELKNITTQKFSNSAFDHCVYSTALGYTDVCVAQFTVTDTRAGVAEWFVIDEHPIYMVTKLPNQMSAFEVFSDEFLIIFRPFSGGTWLVIIFIMLPLLALTIFFQERGIPKSDFPAKTAPGDSGADPRGKYPSWKNLARALYRVLKSYLMRFYAEPVQTYGGSWSVLALCFIGMIGMSLYTAKMAAHLTTEALEQPVDTLEKAIDAGYRFCGERKASDSTMKMYKISNRFVNDPIEEGGDGLPGFNCPSCNALKRPIEYLDPDKANADDRYCHAAIVTEDVLEVFHSQGLHCNKVITGQPLAFSAHGFPLSNRLALPLRSLFMKMKVNGIYARVKQEYSPVSKCPTQQVEQGAQSLTALDLVGVWIVTGSFALIGILVSIYERRHAWHRAISESSRSLCLKAPSFSPESKTQRDDSHHSNDN